MAHSDTVKERVNAEAGGGLQDGDDERTPRTHSRRVGAAGRVRGTDERLTNHGRGRAVDVVATPRMKDARVRLTAVFLAIAGRELNVTDAARLAGLDDKVCHTLLRVLCDTGVLEQRRSGVFVAVRK